MQRKITNRYIRAWEIIRSDGSGYAVLLFLTVEQNLSSEVNFGCQCKLIFKKSKWNRKNSISNPFVHCCRWQGFSHTHPDYALFHS